MQPPDISIVIPTYNRARLLRRTLESVLNQEAEEISFEVIVVDNNCTDDTAAVVESMRATHSLVIRYIVEPHQGNAHARNRGIRSAAARIVAFVDDDSWVAPDWLKNIVGAFQANPGLSFVGGRVLPRWDSEPPSWLTREHWAPIGALDYGSQPMAICEGVLRCLLGANLAIRREALERVGSFSPEAQRVGGGLGSLEDHVLIARLCRAGERGMYLPEIIAYTHVDKERSSRRYHRRWHRGHGRFYALLRDPDWEHSRKPKALGVPAHLYRQIIAAAWGWLIHTLRGRSSKAFSFELQLCFCFGFVVQRVARQDVQRRLL